jgi:hypothetical protein
MVSPRRRGSARRGQAWRRRLRCGRRPEALRRERVRRPIKPRAKRDARVGPGSWTPFPLADTVGGLARKAAIRGETSPSQTVAPFVGSHQDMESLTRERPRRFCGVSREELHGGAAGHRHRVAVFAAFAIWRWR